MKSLTSVKWPIVGGIIGAAVVGAAWSLTYASQQHGQVVAKVDGNPITRVALNQESDAVAGSQVMAQLISNQLVLDAANKANITATSGEVNEALTALERQNNISSESQLDATLAQNHMTKNQLMDQLKTEVLETKLAESKINVTSDQIQAYYSKNKASLTTPEKVSLSDIQVTTQADANHVESLLKSGQSFSKLAMQYSTDTATKNKGGAMGLFAKSNLDASIAGPAFKLKVGQASNPIQVSNGYEIVEVTSIQPEKVPTLDQAKQTIIHAIKLQNAEPAQQLVADLTKQADIQMLDSGYSSVVDELENPAPPQMGNQ